MIVRVTFIDDRGRTGVAQTSSGVTFELAGDWRGTIPAAGPVSVTLVRNGDDLTGEAVSRDGTRFPMSGRMTPGPSLALRCVVDGIGLGGVQMNLEEFEFAGGRLRRVTGSTSGRCPSTVVGSFELERAP